MGSRSPRRFCSKTAKLGARFDGRCRASRYKQSWRIYYGRKGNPRPFLPRYLVKRINKFQNGYIETWTSYVRSLSTTINTPNRIITKKTSKLKNMDTKREYQVSIQKITLTSEFSFKISCSSENERNIVYHTILTYYLWRYLRSSKFMFILRYTLRYNKWSTSL